MAKHKSHLDVLNQIARESGAPAVWKVCREFISELKRKWAGDTASRFLLLFFFFLLQMLMKNVIDLNK